MESTECFLGGVWVIEAIAYQCEDSQRATNFQRGEMEKIMKRRGFTLVELLVVIAIIGILIALLLPAINSAREAARRSSCINNLKQMALAVNTYSEARKRLPYGQWVETPATCGDSSSSTSQRFTNWAIEILPYSEEKQLYDLYNQKLVNTDPVNLAVIKKFINYQICPTDPNARKLDLSAHGAGFTAGMEIATSSYRGVAGLAFLPGTQVNLFNDQRAGVTSTPPYLRLKDRGPLFLVAKNHATGSPTCSAVQLSKTPIKMSQITDGISKTFVVGEYVTVSEPRRAAYWGHTYYGVNLGAVTLPPLCFNVANCNADSYAGQFDPDFNSCSSNSTTYGNGCYFNFSGIHTAGAFNFANCDGSVRTYQNSTSMKAIAAMVTTAGGENVDGL
jgi:prepilin-type N-terminal cleavage/methylation domain-containing protein